MEEALFVARVVLAAVFAVAGLGKLADRPGTRQAFVDFGVPEATAVPFATLLPLAELAVAATLLPDATATAGAIGGLGLLLLFVVGISANLARGRTPDCHCFGQLRSRPAGRGTLVRNVMLATLAGVVAVAGPGGAGNLIGWIGDLRTGEAVALVAAVSLLALVALEGWMLTNLLRQNGRMLLRLDAIENGLRERGIEIVPITPALGLETGSPAPAFELPDLDGRRISLDALLSADKPVALIFTHPDCGPCKELLPDVARWQRDDGVPATIALISARAPEDNRPLVDEHGLSNLLLQRDQEVNEAYQAAGTPTAVVVSTDGEIASPVVAGAEKIKELIAAVRAGQPRGLPVGEAAPDLRLPDLDGKEVGISDLRGQPVLLLFWSLSCGFCERMLPDLKLWELSAGPEAPSLVVISNGSAEENRAMGLRSRILLDEKLNAAQAFGAPGTPMAVLIDADGRVASPPAGGADAVLALARGQHPLRSAH